ncbi:hypothetical protein [Scytonema sp. PRP1]
MTSSLYWKELYLSERWMEPAKNLFRRIPLAKVRSRYSQSSE